MKRIILITIILALTGSLCIWGIHRATAATHTLLGDADYRPFYQILGELF